MTAANHVTPVDLTTLQVGDEIFRTERPVSRDTLVRYAGASGDFNPIHYNDAVAEAAGLPSVIAHGMLTMGMAIAPLVEAIGDPGAVRAYSTRFTKPVEVPATGTTQVEFVGVVGAIDDAARTLRIDVQALVDGAGVLGKARATVAIDAVVPTRDGGAQQA